MTDTPSEPGRDLVPVDPKFAEATKAVAQTIGKGIEAADKFVSYWADVFGTVPHDVVGYLLGGDYLRHRRILKLEELQARRDEIHRQRNVTEPVAANPEVARLIIDAVAEVDSELIQDIWAKLLASATDPARKSFVRKEFAQTLRSMNPSDVLVMNEFRMDKQVGDPNRVPRELVASRNQLEVIEVAASLEHLEKVGVLAKSPSTHYITAYGQTLFRALK